MKEITDREAMDEEFVALKTRQVEAENASDTISSTDFGGECFLEPIGNRIIIQEDPFKEPSKLIKTPSNAQRRPTTGKVVKIGPGIETIKLGDRVLFGNFSGTLVKFRERPAYRILSEDEVIAKVTKTDEQLEETR